MVRLFLSVSLGMFWFFAGVGYPAGEEVQVKIAPEKTDRSLVVNLRVSRDEGFAKTMETVKQIEDAGATHWSMRVVKAQEDVLAEVLAQPQVPAKRVAAVVEKLLGSGFTRITVDVKK